MHEECFRLFGKLFLDFQLNLFVYYAVFAKLLSIMTLYTYPSMFSRNTDDVFQYYFFH